MTPLVGMGLLIVAGALLADDATGVGAADDAVAAAAGARAFGLLFGGACG